MAISLRAAGTATSATAAVTAVNPAVPTGAVSGDLSVLTVWMKPFGTTITTPAGWTKIDEAMNGIVAAGTDTGSTKIAVFVKESAAVGAIGNISFAGSPNSCGAVINTYQKGAGNTWDTSQFTTGADGSNNPNYSATGAGGISVATGDWVCQGTAVNGDLGTPSAFAIAGMSGATIGTYVSRQSAAVSTGRDTRGVVGDVPISAGSSNSVPTFTYTNASSGSGTTLWLRLREAPMVVTGSLTLGGSGTIAGAPMATLVDDFTTYPNSKWTAAAYLADGVSVGGKVEIAPPNSISSNGFDSVDRWSLANSEIVLEVSSVTTVSVNFGSVFVVSANGVDDATQCVTLSVVNGTLAADVIDGAGNSIGSNSVAWNATNHRWWKITQDSSLGVSVYFSTDGSTWGTAFLTATATALYTNARVHTYAYALASGGPFTPFTVDNFNNVGAPPNTAAGSITLGGSATARAAATASGSLVLGGTGTAQAPTTASGSLALTGTANWRVQGIAGSLALAGTSNWRVQGITGSLALGGSGAAQGRVTSATGSLTLGGSATARGAATASGSLALGGSAATVVLGIAGSLALAGSATAQAPVTAAGSLALDGTATATSGSTNTAAGSLTLDATSSAAASASSSGSLTLGGSATAAAPATTAGSLVLGGTANWRVQGIGGSLTLAGSGTARAAATATGSVSLAGTANWRVQGVTGALTLAATSTARAAATATGSLTLAGTAVTQAPITATGSLTLAGSASAVGGGSTTASGSLTLGGSATAVSAVAATATGSLSVLGAAQVGVGYANTNDLWYTAHPLPTLPAVVSGDTTGFVDWDGYYPGAFWTFTPTETRSYVFDTWGSSFDTILRVYATSADLLINRYVAINDDFGYEYTSKIKVTLHAGTTYYIKVSGFGGARGPYWLRARAGYDNFSVATATMLPSVPFSYIDTVNGEPNNSVHSNGATFWKYVPSTSGTVVFDTVGSAFDAYAYVLASDGTTVLASDRSSGGGAQASVSYAVTAGTVYYLVVSGDAGNLTRGDLWINVRSGPTPTGPGLGSLTLGGSATAIMTPNPATGSVTMGGSAASSGTSTISGSINLTGSVLAGTLSTVGGSITLDGTFSVTLAATATGTLELSAYVGPSVVGRSVVYAIDPADWPAAFDQFPRGLAARSSGRGRGAAHLWAHHTRPSTVRALLVYQPSATYPAGRVVATSHSVGAGAWDADLVIVTPQTYQTTDPASWEATVLAANGYSLIPVGLTP